MFSCKCILDDIPYLLFYEFIAGNNNLYTVFINIMVWCSLSYKMYWMTLNTMLNKTINNNAIGNSLVEYNAFV